MLIVVFVVVVVVVVVVVNVSFLQIILLSIKAINLIAFYYFSLFLNNSSDVSNLFK